MFESSRRWGGVAAKEEAMSEEKNKYVLKQSESVQGLDVEDHWDKFTIPFDISKFTILNRWYELHNSILYRVFLTGTPLKS